MKQKDIALLVVIVIVAGVMSLLITQTIFVSKKSRDLTAEKVDPIQAEFKKPDTKVFNSKSINPTQLIKIGDGSNPAPF
jgi:flagellar basal body-associated protein FliL